ncbi:MAG: acyltransferase family protein [Arenimonas sp.]|nr:acyltransferase family protein [Arenimonas sp.]
MPAPQDRLHYMDHLRALAMLAGVFFHAALAYSPLMHGFFPTADRDNSGWVDVVAWALHLVRMPLFFLVAGFFAAWVIEKRGGAAFARQRVRRIALPFLLAWPLVWMSLSAAVVWAVANVQHPSAFLVMVREWMAMDDPPQAPLGTSHLWFLYYLLLLAVLQWVARTLDLARPVRWVLARHQAWLLLGLPLLLVPALASVSAPHPAPEGLLPQFWAIVFYGAFYALGAGLQQQPAWLERARACAPWLAVGSAALYALFLWRLSIELPGATQPSASCPVAALEACLSVWLTVLCLLAGQRWLTRHSATLQYLAQSAYWTYLLHLPVLFWLQFWLMDRAMAWPLKFALASAGTLAICLLSYQGLVRHTPLRRFVG